MSLANAPVNHQCDASWHPISTIPFRSLTGSGKWLAILMSSFWAATTWITHRSSTSAH
jgi:hypothetical protein